jgi:ABC transporter DrrB family efflux protein
MTAITMTRSTLIGERTSSPAVEWLQQTAALIRRNLTHMRREPLQLSDATIQPVLFTLLFVYVFGGAMAIAGGSYKEFAIGGLIAMNLTTGSMGTAVGITTDLATGVVDRFRTLPMSRSSILVARAVSDLLVAAIATSIVMLTGLAIGWRTNASAVSVLGGFGVALLFAFALSWFMTCVGLVSSGAESAQGVGLIILFPLAFVSNAFVPTQGMPHWLGTIANWNPVSAMASAVRNQFGNPNPSATIHAWPMQHPVAASVLWSFAIIAVASPIAVQLFRRRTTD